MEDNIEKKGWFAEAMSKFGKTIMIVVLTVATCGVGLFIYNSVTKESCSSDTDTASDKL